jgi:DNA-binding MarR family transcriptional regulator
MKHNSMFPPSERSLALARLNLLQGELDDLKSRLGEKEVFASALETASVNARAVVRRRRNRERLFGDGLFFDPAWDILLELFVAQTREQRLAVSELGVATAIPQTTTLRWLAQLEKSGLITRRPDPVDARRIFVQLTSKAFDAMQSYFA